MGDFAVTADETNRLLALVSEWEQVALKCDAVAARHRAKGERLQAIEQAAFATGRRACAESLKRALEAQP